ncbi:MAG: glycosyltransferase family 4 protein [Chloroflexi bacterium]|nr:glycosyltransferase family 4 protein [Chloroflexota bacterium]
MRFVYLANVRLPGEKAHAIQIMQTCAALAAQVDVCLVHARRTTRPWLRQVTDLRSYYGLPCDVRRRTIPSLDLFYLPSRLPFRRLPALRFVFVIQMLTYHLALIPFLLKSRADVYYTRDTMTAALLVLLRRNCRVFLETHSFPSSRSGLTLQRWLVGHVSGLIVLTQELAKHYAQLGCPPRRIAVVPDAVDAEAFEQCSATDSRQRSGIEPGDAIIMYVGQMYSWKGVDVLVAAASKLPAKCQVWLVGGTPEELPRVEKLIGDLAARNVTLKGYVTPSEVPGYLSLASVLVLPNSGKADVSRYYTSPLKMFEYLAAGRPIVASDLPSLREVLRDGENALLFRADDPDALAAAIRCVLEDASLAERLARQGRSDAKAYSWPARARAILQFIDSLGV